MRPGSKRRARAGASDEESGLRAENIALQEKLEEARTRIRELDLALRQARTGRVEASSRVTQLQATCTSLTSSLRDAERQLRSSIEEKRLSDEQLAEYMNREIANNTEKEALQRQILEYRRRWQSAEASLPPLVKQLALLKSEHKSAREEVRRMAQRLDRVERDHAREVGDLTKDKQQARALLDEMLELSRRASGVVSQLAASRKSTQDLRRGNRELLRELEELDAAVKQARSEREEAAGAAERLRLESAEGFQKWQNEKEKLGQTIAALREQLNDAERRLQHATELRNDAARVQDDESQRIIATLRQELEQLRSNSAISQPSSQRSFESESVMRSELALALQDVRRENRQLDQFLDTRRRLEEILVVMNDSVPSFSDIREDSPRKQAEVDDEECQVVIDDVDQIAAPRENPVISDDEEPEHEQQPAAIARPPVGDAHSDTEEESPVAAKPSEKKEPARADRVLRPTSPPPPASKPRADSGKTGLSRPPDRPPRGGGQPFTPPRTEKVVPARPVGQIPDDALDLDPELDNDFLSDDAETTFSPKRPQGGPSRLSDPEGLPAAGDFRKPLAEFKGKTEAHELLPENADDEEEPFTHTEEDRPKSPAQPDHSRPAPAGPNAAPDRPPPAPPGPNASPDRPPPAPPGPNASPDRPPPAPPGPNASRARPAESPGPSAPLDNAEPVDGASGSAGEEEEEEEDARPVLANLDDLLPTGDRSGGDSKADDKEEEDEGEFVVKGRSGPLAGRNAQVGEEEDTSEELDRVLSQIRSDRQARRIRSLSAEDNSDGVDSDGSGPESGHRSPQVEYDNDFDDVAEASPDAHHPERVPGNTELRYETFEIEYDDDDDDHSLMPPPRPRQVAMPPDNSTRGQTRGPPAPPVAQGGDEGDDDLSSDDDLAALIQDGRSARVASRPLADNQEGDSGEEDADDDFLLPDEVANNLAPGARELAPIVIEDEDGEDLLDDSV